MAQLLTKHTNTSNAEQISFYMKTQQILKHALNNFNIFEAVKISLTVFFPVIAAMETVPEVLSAVAADGSIVISLANSVKWIDTSSETKSRKNKHN